MIHAMIQAAMMLGIVAACATAIGAFFYFLDKIVTPLWLQCVIWGICVYVGVVFMLYYFPVTE